MAELVIMECPSCGRIWCYSAAPDWFSPTDPLTPHLPPEPLSHGLPSCWGVPERVQNTVVAAAYALGGAAAAEACITYQLRDAIRAYERATCGAQYRGDD